MGDAKVKQPYFGTPPHQQATTSKAGLVVSPTTMIDTLKPSGKDDAASKSPTKYELLKARKAELEKRLNEKYAQLQQIKREEAQLIGMYPSDFSSGVGSQDQNGAAPTLRRKIGTSFKLPENLLNNKEDDINKLLLEKQIQQQISEASLRFANDTSQPKSSQPASQQHLDLLPQSPRFYDHENHNLPPHYYQSQEHPSQNNLSARHPDLLISPTLSASSSNTLTSPTLRPYSSVSPTPSTITTTSTAAIIHATPDIQTESPKNVTIVQQGKIMPYKEVTKPFEMSDFYKYSTKFKEKKQQQQQQQHHHQGQHHQMHQHQFHHPQQQQQQQLADQLSPNGNSMGPNGELMQRAVYQPPNPSICRPINYN
ncbi:hypothetical protein pipiens_013751 [Culex pipiens pipiens]|uniref:Cytohesin Ubiquitin Protein Inducing domain-containing protein n=1 Tax=Culex pipiens pipiens TaxID=38569 RepID=A0ABD1CX98_CULPP